jgi:hypothetical protein
MSDQSLTPRQVRWGSAARGIAIAVLLAVYGWVANLGGASFISSLLVAAGLQIAILLSRRFLPAYLLPQVIDTLELLADAATVLLFALGVFGGIMSYSIEM